MAVFNEILNARYAKSLVKLFGMKGGNPAKQLTGEISATHSIATGVENRVLEQWNRFFQSFNLALPGAGNFQVIRLAGQPGVIGVVEKIVISAGGAAASNPVILYGIGTPTSTASDLGGGAVSGVNHGFDNRGLATPNLHLSTSAVAASGLIPIAFYNLPVNGNVDVILYENHEITLPPGSAIDISTSTANLVLIGTIWWRERFLEDSERLG